MPEKIESVRIAPQALAAMALHASQYQHESVCGFVLGTSISKSKVEVTHAIAVAHDTVTWPILETAMGLMEESKIVGWYVVPRLLDDEQPDPVSLRIAAQLATGGNESILVVVQNQPMIDCIHDGEISSSFVKVLGRDFGDQWLDDIKNINTGDSKVVSRLVLEAIESETKLVDLLDHLASPSTTSWPCTTIADLCKRMKLGS